MKADLKSMSRKELEKLRSDVDKALEKIKDRELQLARAAAEKAAAAHGFSLTELAAGAAPKKRGRKPGSTTTAAKPKAAPKYRNPADPTQTWTGRGRKPQWFKDGEAAGRPIADFAI